MKPFNLEHAKAGAPVALEDGTEATIIKFDGRNEECPLVVLVGGKDRPHLASTKGYVNFGPMNSPKQLVMHPIGTLQDREVYYGDTLLYNGRPTLITGTTCNFDESHKGIDTKVWSWPTSYPATRMTDEELDQAAMSSADHHIHLGQVANAAIRHGIDNGYLLDAYGEHGKSVERGRILAEIARDLGWTSGYAYADIPAAVRMREVAIARRFYNKGCINITTGLMHPLYRALEASEITAELAKVKP